MQRRLKYWATANLDVSHDATDETFQKRIDEALADGSLTAAKYMELKKSDPDDPREKLKVIVREVIKEDTPQKNPRQQRRNLMSQINVLPESQKYNNQRTYLKHART